MAERICTLSCDQGIITIASILNALSMTVLIIVLAIIRVIKRGEITAASGSLKDKKTLKKLLNKPADTLKRLAGENGEALLLAIIGSVVR